MNNNFINIGLPTDSGGFFELQKAHENFMNQPHYTKYELNIAQSGFLDARNSIYNTVFSAEKYYNLTHELYPKLTEPQKEILDLYLCSGYNQAYITKLKNFQSSRAVLFHLEAISKKINKIGMITKKIDNDSHIIEDTYTGRYASETVEEWFRRMNDE